MVSSIVFLILGRGEMDDPCELALNQAAELVTSGDAEGGRTQAVFAVSACSGPAQARARDLLTIAEQAIAGRAACDRGLRQVKGFISERRLVSAKAAFDQLAGDCLQPSEKSVLLEQIQSGQNQAMAAELDARRFLASGNLDGANEAVEKMAAGNREHPGLSALRRDVQAALRSSRAAASQPATEASPARVDARTTAAQPTVSTAANPMAQLVKTFLRDAEIALNQKRFDAAKTLVDSALRIEPQNAEAGALVQRIRAKELQYLKEETTIR